MKINAIVILLAACGANGNGTRGYDLVYLVDDSQTSRMAAEARVASLSGIAVRTFETGGAAVAALSTDIPDVIITDLRMEGVNGLAGCRAARRHKIPCIIITAGEANHRELRAAGAGWWLYKKDLDSLPSVVRDALESRKSP